MDGSTRDAAVERYLDRVRAALRGLPGSEVDDILRELRVHIDERSASGYEIEAVLRSLGEPEDIAREYHTDHVTARAEGGHSPLAVLHSLVLLRRGSAVGWIVLGCTAFLYAWGIALVAAAIEKLLSPHDVGLWYRTGTVSIPRLTIDGAEPPGTRELLGWWIVPAGTVAGAGLLYAAGQLGLWWIRRSRAGREPQPGGR